MSPVIRISEDTYERLKPLAEAFTDKPDDVIKRLLDFFEAGETGNNEEKRAILKASEAPLARNNSISAISTSHSTSLKQEDTDISEQEATMLALPAVSQRDLSKHKPKQLEINDQRIQVKDWTDLCVKLVKWLEMEGHLSQKHMPISNHARKNKYFINSKPEHKDPSKDGKWNQAGSFWIDTKYSSDTHVKNLQSMLDEIGRNELQVKIGPF